MNELDPIKFAHPLKKSAFKMREVRVYIFSTDRTIGFRPFREGMMQPEPDAVCTCHIPDLDFVDKRGYLMSLLKRVHRERLGAAKDYKFDFKVYQ